MLESGAQTVFTPLVKFVPLKVKMGNKQDPTHHCATGLVDVNVIAVFVTVMVPEVAVTLPPDPVTLIE
jgi:hypothetical protein